MAASYFVADTQLRKIGRLHCPRITPKLAGSGSRLAIAVNAGEPLANLPVCYCTPSFGRWKILTRWTIEKQDQYDEVQRGWEELVVRARH